MKIFICLFIIYAKLFAQSDSEIFEMKSLYYLEGKWIIEGMDQNIHEEWKKENDTLLTSVSFYVKNGDTTNAETVKLQKNGKDIFYIPTVEHNPGSVKFKLISLSDDKAVFENPEHDFPTRIIYEKINNDSLHASIEGMIQEKTKVIGYPFKRVK